MTALDDRPKQRREPALVSRAGGYEWHAFMERLAHLYQTAQVRSEWPPMLLPWCEEGQSFLLRHDRDSVTDHVVRPIPGHTCEKCERRLMAATLDALRAQGLIWEGLSRGEA